MRQAPDEIDMLLVVLDMAGDVNSSERKNGAGGSGQLVYCAVQDRESKTFSLSCFGLSRLDCYTTILFTNKYKFL